MCRPNILCLVIKLLPSHDPDGSLQFLHHATQSYSNHQQPKRGKTVSDSPLNYVVKNPVRFYMQINFYQVYSCLWYLNCTSKKLNLWRLMKQERKPTEPVLPYLWEPLTPSAIISYLQELLLQSQLSSSLWVMTGLMFWICILDWSCFQASSVGVAPTECLSLHCLHGPCWAVGTLSGDYAVNNMAVPSPS